MMLQITAILLLLRVIRDCVKAHLAIMRRRRDERRGEAKAELLFLLYQLGVRSSYFKAIGHIRWLDERRTSTLLGES